MCSRWPQNTNEPSHNLIWTRLELAVADATIVYNEGELGGIAIYEELKLMFSQINSKL